MFNKAILIGRLTKDPEIRYTAQNNLPVCSFTIAVNRPYSQNQEKTADFLNCVAWRKQAENVHNYCFKGSLVAVEGKIQTRDYMDEKTNTRRYITEVVCDSVTFLDTKKSSEEKPTEKVEELPNGNFDKVEDDLPFD